MTGTTLPRAMRSLTRVRFSARRKETYKNHHLVKFLRYGGLYPSSRPVKHSPVRSAPLINAYILLLSYCLLHSRLSTYRRALTQLPQ